MSTQREDERRAALEAVLEAARFTLVVREHARAGDGFDKADRSPVTIADFGAQALICRALEDRFPDDPIVAEESSAELRRPENEHLLARLVELLPANRAAGAGEVCEWIDRGGGGPSERFWTLDPLDGTRGFLRGDQYAIALALIVEGQVQLGVLACPALPHALDRPGEGQGVVFVAERGHGWQAVALDAPETTLPAPREVIERAVYGVEPSTSDHELQARLAREVGLTADPLRLDSQAKYAAVARGDAALYLRLPNPATPDYREKIWDHAAGALLVEEAGGVVSDSTGQPLDFSAGRELARNRGVIASRNIDHARVLDALRGL